MPSIRLTQRRVDTLRPRPKVCDIRDAKLKGYGVRVKPSGASPPAPVGSIQLEAASGLK